jgi:alkanesulfonate monooxygenase SsuD/methylene tetrahydromethanopterin reductase-like flavin-dependent oxidoreductase (luciferase family)
MRQIGAKVASPLTYLREYLTCLTALLRGETVTQAGRYVSLSDVRLAWPPSPGMELLAAATGPRTLQLSGELASGTILTGGTTPDETRDAIAHIRTGQAAGVDRGRHSVLAHVICTTGANAREEAMREVEHWDLDPERAVVASGTPTEIADSCRRWVSAGADTVILQPTAAADLESFITTIGTDVLPLIKR